MAEEREKKLIDAPHEREQRFIKEREGERGSNNYFPLHPVRRNGAKMLGQKIIMATDTRRD